MTILFPLAAYVIHRRDLAYVYLLPSYSDPKLVWGTRFGLQHSTSFASSTNERELEAMYTSIVSEDSDVIWTARKREDRPTVLAWVRVPDTKG